MKVTGSEESCSEGLSLLTEEFVVCCFAVLCPVMTCSSAMTLDLLVGMHAVMSCVIATLMYASLTFARSLVQVTLYMSPCAGNRTFTLREEPFNQ